jgi:hypothetical protein
VVDRLLAERKARGDYPATKLIDVISGGTTSDERRQTYGNALCWLHKYHRDSDEDTAIAAIRAANGADAVADIYAREAAQTDPVRRQRSEAAQSRHAQTAAETFRTRGDTPGNQESDNPSQDAASRPDNSRYHPLFFTIPKNNKRYTNPECWKAIVRHFASQFKKGDTFADPGFGKGAAYNALAEILPEGTIIDWCEIDPETEQVKLYGRDFLDFHEHRTWGITNPAWSADEYGPIFQHALACFDNIIFLIRRLNAEAPARRKQWESAGFGLKEIAVVDWKFAGFPQEGRAELAAFHWQRGYVGNVRHRKIEPPKHPIEAPQPMSYWGVPWTREETNAMYPPVTGEIDVTRFQRQLARMHRDRLNAAIELIKANPTPELRAIFTSM